MTHPKKGFTLIELAIVLVIVGLLIGGILAARSMIKGTEIQAMTRQIGQYDIAIENFQEKFRGLPGDSSKFYGSGDNDGKIEDDDGTNGKGELFAGEVANFWPNLEAATQIRVSSLTPANLNDIEPAAGERFTATITGNIKNSGSAINIPPTKIGNSKTGIVVTNDYLTPANANSLTTRKLEGAYILANFEGVNDDTEALATNLAASIKPTDVLALDKKLDDGIANTGAVIALPETASCNSSGTYAVATNADVCALAVGYLRLHNAKLAAGAGGGGVCGDGNVDSGEQCDDGNTTALDGCSATCETEVNCGGCFRASCPPNPSWCSDGTISGHVGSWNPCNSTCDGYSNPDLYCQFAAGGWCYLPGTATYCTYCPTD